MITLAVDPGTTESGYVYLGEDRRVITSGIEDNEHMLKRIQHLPCVGMVHYAFDALAIEMIASYGMPVGREVFETCVWVGRFKQAWCEPDAVKLIYRRDVKLHLCGSARAKDPNVRQALLDMLGPQGTKKAPGPCYGVKSHAWAALAVAVTAGGLR